VSAEAASMPARPLHVLLVAGEASGDAHAGEFVAEFRRLAPAATFRGIGGEGARANGMQTLLDIGDVATMGLTEVASRGRAILGAYRRLRRELREARPDLLVLIDFPEFNLALAGVAHRLGVPVLYYVSPQVWAWRRGRVKKILRRVDRLAAIFPFEKEVYGRSDKVAFVGHPAIDRVRPSASPAATLARHGLDPAKRVVMLLPGSRKHEVELLLPEMLGALERLAPGRDLQFALGLAQTIPKELVERLLVTAKVPVSIIESEVHDLIAASALVLAASGTVTLETAVLGRPMVIAYKVSRTTFFFARLLVRVPFIGIVNLIANRKIVPELVQDEATGERIAAEAAVILDDAAVSRRIADDLAEVRKALGSPGAARRAAELGLELAERARA
jgi:lipid-A-disaccharide synthase